MATKLEFISNIRKKYPQYDSVDDETLYSKIIEKYPVYKEQITEDVVEKPEGFFGTVKEMVTGEYRTTPEIEQLQTIGDLPELNKMSIAGLKSAFTTLTSDPEEAVQALQSNFPGIEARQDEKGNWIVKSPTDQKEYVVNPPGIDARDIIRGGLTAAMFAGPGRAAKLGARVLGSAGVQAGIEAGQAATGGEFDVEQVPLAGATELIAPGVSGTVRGVRGLTRGRKIAESAAEEAVRTAEDVGITPLTSDIIAPETRASKLAQSITERIPFTGTGRKRVAQQAQRFEAVRNVLRDFGADETAQVSDDVMTELVKKRSKDLTKYTPMKKDVIERLSDKGIVPVSKTQQTLVDEFAKLKSLKTKSVEPLVKVFEDFSEAIDGQDLNNIELLRKQLKEQLKDPGLASVKSTGEKSLSKIYNSLRDDMGDFIKATGEPRDFSKWKVADTQLAKMVGEIKETRLKSILKKGDATPEVVRELLFSKKPSEIKLLYKNLTPEGRDRAKIAIFQEITEKAGGLDKVTPDKFVEQLKKFEKSSDIFFKKKDKQVVQGLIKALDLTKRAAEANIQLSTGAEATSFLVPTFLGGMLGGSAIAGGAATGSLGLLARAYESKSMRNILLQLAKAPKGKEEDILKKLTPLIQSYRQTQGD